MGSHDAPPDNVESREPPVVVHEEIPHEDVAEQSGGMDLDVVQWFVGEILDPPKGYEYMAHEADLPVAADRGARVIARKDATKATIDGRGAGVGVEEAGSRAGSNREGCCRKLIIRSGPIGEFRESRSEDLGIPKAAIACETPVSVAPVPVVAEAPPAAFDGSGTGSSEMMELEE